jgi:Domain of unknown function (DUF4262)
MSDRQYITQRTQTWHSRDIKPSFVEAIDRIEEFGLQVLHVTEGGFTPAFSYTTGVFDTCGKPELISVGLPVNTAHSALNYAAELMKGGVDLSIGRHKHVLGGEIEVEFRPVDPKWLHHVMLRTNWYYEGADVPVLQLIYPDLENRFQGEDGFNDNFLQPILSGEINHGSPEYDFWASMDRDNSLYQWKFKDSPHTSAYITKTVDSKEEPVVFVSHDRDGDWQFLGDSMSDRGGPLLVCLHHPVDNDPSLQELHDLPVGWYAERSAPGEPWRRHELPPEDEPGSPK